jgi:hypothetical protein
MTTRREFMATVLGMAATPFALGSAFAEQPQSRFRIGFEESGVPPIDVLVYRYRIEASHKGKPLFRRVSKGGWCSFYGESAAIRCRSLRSDELDVDWFAAWVPTNGSEDAARECQRMARRAEGWCA